MKHVFTYLDNLGTWIIGIFGSMFALISGYTNETFGVLLLVMLVDITSGVMKGIHKRKLRSAIMSVGLMKKGALLLSIIFAILLDILLNSSNPVFSTMMTWVAIGNESLSIIENLSALGVKIPKAIGSRIELILKENEEKDL